MDRRDAPAVYAMTARGAALGRRLAADLGGQLFVPRRLAGQAQQGFDSLPALAAQTFGHHPAHIFVCAAGIAVRAIAPHVAAKDRDPAVVVVSEDGRHAIPILSGHLGGANALARRIAGLLGGQAIITTATDLCGLPALDDLARERHLAVADASRVKNVSAALLEGRPVALYDPAGLLGLQAASHFIPVEQPGDLPTDAPAVWVHWRSAPDLPGLLALHPRVLAAGVGCRRGATCQEIVAALRGVLHAAGLAPQSLAALASVDLKADEAGLLEAARHLGLPLDVYTRTQLSGVNVPSPSIRVMEKIGCAGVCEAAALLAAGGGQLLAAKTISGRVTVAVALRSVP